MGGRGASGGSRALGRAIPNSSAKATTEERTADISVESKLDYNDENYIKGRVLGWDAEDWGGKAMYNKASKLKKDGSDLYEQTESLRTELAGRKQEKINSEADREKYYKQLAGDYKRAQQIIKKANTLYSKWSDIQRSGKLKQYTDRDVDDFKRATDHLLSTASAIKRNINAEGTKYRVFFTDDGKIIKYPDYKKRK